MSTDRTTLRRTLGDRLGDMLVLEATHSSVDAATFRDVVRLGDRGDNAPSIVNKIAYLSGQSHEARISAFASSTRTLTFTPDAPVAPVTGDELELWNTTERIGSISTLHRLINTAIANVAGRVMTETWEPAARFNARTPALSIPADWVEIGGATWTDPQGYYHDVPESAIRVQPGTRRLIIGGRAAWRADRNLLQLWGYAPAPPLEADDDATDVDPEWLIEAVLGWIALAASARASDIRGPSEERRGNYWGTQAQLYRRNVGAPRRGLGIRL